MSGDPGGVFASDAHRRVLGHCRAPHEEPGDLPLEPAPNEKESLRERLAKDAHLRIQMGDVDGILDELEASGYLERGEGRVRMSAAGFEALTGPNDPEPPPMTEARVMALREAGEIDDEAVEAWRQAVGGQQ